MKEMERSNITVLGTSIFPFIDQLPYGYREEWFKVSIRIQMPLDQIDYTVHSSTFRQGASIPDVMGFVPFGTEPRTEWSEEFWCRMPYRHVNIFPVEGTL